MRKGFLIFGKNLGICRIRQMFEGVGRGNIIFSIATKLRQTNKHFRAFDGSPAVRLFAGNRQHSHQGEFNRMKKRKNVRSRGIVAIRTEEYNFRP